ncbi:MAG TPA: hypothetical protein VLT87_11080 [Thermoanaerobaculia bacterium]|nr:hypothetical protein [Thermoanaerobaculia bacterium]
MSTPQDRVEALLAAARLCIEDTNALGAVTIAGLRLQFAERVPGGLSMAAKALGLSEEDLVREVAAGNVPGWRLFPRLRVEVLSALGGEP